MTKVQKVIKYGNSLAVAIPKGIAEKMKLEAGMLVGVDLEDGRCVIKSIEIVPGLSETDEKFVKNLFAKRKKVFEDLAKR